MPPTFRFKADTHTYFVGTRPVPAITTVLRASGRVKEGPWFKPEHRERGKAVHLATLYFDLGLKQLVDPRWEGYFEGYVKFARETRPRWRELEQPRLHRKLGYAGTPDRIGFVIHGDAIVEIKTGGVSDWHAIQTAAQDILIGGPAPGRRRLALYLPGDGEYFLREHKHSTDYLKFFTDLQKVHDGETNHDWADDDERFD